MQQYWINLTDAQAALLSTLVIVVAGGVGVLFRVAVFGKRVRSLESALEETERKIHATLRASATTVDTFNASVAEKLATVDEQFSATLDALGQLRNSVAGLQDAADKSADSLRDQLSAHWNAIASGLEEIASDQTIHGKTRARYSRIPRRTLNELYDTLIEDGRIPAERAKDFKSAIELWSWHRNGRPPLSQQDVDKMKELAIRLVSNYRP